MPPLEGEVPNEREAEGFVRINGARKPLSQPVRAASSPFRGAKAASPLGSPGWRPLQTQKFLAISIHRTAQLRSLREAKGAAPTRCGGNRGLAGRLLGDPYGALQNLGAVAKSHTPCRGRQLGDPSGEAALASPGGKLLSKAKLMRGGDRLVNECNWMDGICPGFLHPTWKSETFSHRHPSSVTTKYRFRDADISS